MTGEITLRVGFYQLAALRKVLAANRMGIEKVILPYENKKDLDEIPDKIRRKMEFVLVKDMDKVLEHALVKRADEDEDS